MWDRIGFKSAGKTVFKTNYWIFVGVSLLLAIALGGGIFKDIADEEVSVKQIITEGVRATDLARVGATAAIGGSGILGIAFSILVAAPFEVGARRFFLEKRLRDDAKFSVVWTGFNKKYGNVVLTRFLEKLYIALLCLLFIIPGIVRAYGYFCVPYILAENPDLDHNRALKLSREMTMGYKGLLFELDLSFIGWAILSVITAEIVGIFYSNPYYNATKAEAYAFLRENALRSGIATINELPGFSDSTYFPEY